MILLLEKMNSKRSFWSREICAFEKTTFLFGKENTSDDSMGRISDESVGIFGVTVGDK